MKTKPKKSRIFLATIAIAALLLLIIVAVFLPNRNAENKPTETESASEKNPSESDDPTKESETQSEEESEDPTAESEDPTKESEKPTKETENGFTVCIDAGHQQAALWDTEPIGPGSDVMKQKLSTGTQGVATGIPEYEINRQVALKLKEELLRRGYAVVMIRETNDCPKSNAERAEIANTSGADIFLRLHCNSVTDASVTGIINYAPAKTNPYMAAVSNHLAEDSIRLSQNLVDEMCAVTGAKNRGLIIGDTMTGINWSRIPVSLVEMGFMSNPEEDRKLATDEYQWLLVKGMANAVDKYFGQ